MQRISPSCVPPIGKVKQKSVSGPAWSVTREVGSWGYMVIALSGSQNRKEIKMRVCTCATHCIFGGKITEV